MHLEIHHHEHQGDMSVFKCKVLGTYKRSQDRQVAEGVQLERSEADLVLNSMAVRCPVSQCPMTHVTYVTYMYLYSSNHMYVVFMFYLSININNSPVCHEAVLADCLGHVST